MKKIYHISGIDCAACAGKLEKAICNLEHIDNATLNFFTEKLTIEASEDKFEELLPIIKKTVKKLEPDAVLK